MKRYLIGLSATLRLCGLILLLAAAIIAQTVDYTRWVNPFIGTGGHGHTFPGATMPFGMVQLSPDTRVDNWDGSSGYHYSDDMIYGFSHTHLSGTGIPDYCDILFMPTMGVSSRFERFEEKDKSSYPSKFSHSTEKAEPGYYSVKLDDADIAVELTTTPRVGLHRYTFHKSDDANIILNLKWRDNVLDSNLVLVGNNRVEGYRRSSSWATDQVIYFVAEFSKPFKNAYTRDISPGGMIVYDHNKMRRTGMRETFGSKNLAANFQFQTLEGEKILVKVALSTVSIEGARKNLAAELPGWNFDKVRADARTAWNKELSKIEVSGGTDAQTTTFYTALYHTMIQPNIAQDVDGRYLGHDRRIHNINDDGVSGRGDTAQLQKPARKQGRNTQRPSIAIANARALATSSHYTVFSLWDTFRAAHPLYSIIDQKRTVGFINTFIRQYEQGGRLPVWELAANETDCMIGYHAVSVIADAMAKGIKGFDYEKAYEAAKHSAELDHFGLAAYKRRGYISAEDENESVSKTLEYAYDDWCISLIAGELGFSYLKKDDKASREKAKMYIADAMEFVRRSKSFENLFDSSTGFMRPKKNGGFVTPFSPQEVTFNFTEGNSWVYTFFVPQNVSRMIELQGGKERFAAKLDELFTTKEKLSGREQPDITGLIGQYAHGNEPSHHIAYLYDAADQPWKTQKYVRQILDEFYKPTPDGLIGNEDCGQMSAWYVLSASGFYPNIPVALKYDFGTPLFKEVKYHLENGKTFIVRAPNVSSENYYIRSARLNGVKLDRSELNHEDLGRGGVLEFDMTNAPVKNAFSPAFYFNYNLRFSPVPVIEGGPRVFNGQTPISIRSDIPKARIYYTTDGTKPNLESAEYTSPFVINSTTQIRAIAVNEKGIRSQVAEAMFLKKPNDWTIKIATRYNRQYTGGGDEGLIDGIRGSLNFASGEWQGYQPQDLIATIDLQRATEIKRVGGGFLQNARTWIWMPTHIEFETSMDGVSFTRVADIKTDMATDDMREAIKDYVQTISPVRARYVRVHAYNLGKIPSWHPGAGSDAFIFVDEIIIE